MKLVRKMLGALAAWQAGREAKARTRALKYRLAEAEVTRREHMKALAKLGATLREQGVSVPSRKKGRKRSPKGTRPRPAGRGRKVRPRWMP